MINFAKWLHEQEMSEANISEINWKGLLAGGALLSGLAGGGAQAAKPYEFSGEKLVGMGASEKRLQQDEHFITSWSMIKEKITNEIQKNPYIEFLNIEIISEHHQGNKIAVVTFSAKVRATDEATAKQILIREITKSAAKVGLQAEAIRGLKQIFVPSKMSNENNGSVFSLKLILTPKSAEWK